MRMQVMSPPPTIFSSSASLSPSYPALGMGGMLSKEPEPLSLLATGTVPADTLHLILGSVVRSHPRSPPPAPALPLLRPAQLRV